ncbi:MAG: SCO family protein [Halioglobus sp.]|nr:SCO family protein [Halioglobus sp.]
MSQSANIKITVAFLLVFMLVLVAGFVYRIGAPRAMTEAEMKVHGLYLLETPRSFGELKLVDHRGQPFERSRFEGEWSLLFFGFTYCPDICPTTMALLNEFVGALDENERVTTQVVMVSVDPARDTVAKLAEYVPFFNPDFVGVTGEFLDIHRFATALNTPFRKVPGQSENYLVDHSANVVLINPRGDYHGFFKTPLAQADMLLTYRAVRSAWERNH